MVVFVDIVDGTAIGRHISVESPLVPQHVREHLPVGAHGDPVHRVVAAHHAQSAPLLYAGLKGWEVVVDKLGQRDLRVEVVPRDHGAVDHRVLELVRQEVLARRHHLHVVWVLALLKAAHVARYVLGSQVRILAGGLLVAAPPGVALHVRVRSPIGEAVADMGVVRPQVADRAPLHAHRAPDRQVQGVVQGRRHGARRGEAGGALRHAAVADAGLQGPVQALRPPLVRRQPQARHGRRVVVQQRLLLQQREPAHEISGPLVHAELRVAEGQRDRGVAPAAHAREQRPPRGRRGAAGDACGSQEGRN
mmetsp:Transcript_95562/g.248851  ORF Transcript_95562/g.248851 Transcript_95562/m.248851 type:complete len:306 (-) Transcript_95562:75-992(-)